MAKRKPPQLSSLIVTKRGSGGTWLDKLDPSTREELLAFRVEFKANNGLAMPTARNIKEHWQLSVGAATLAKWLQS